ncbi:MAG: enoyl-CoA hydratase/isomerase family protein [Hyphomicrobiaceae bacterium]
MTEGILSRLDGQILRVTFNRPDAGNGATDEMARALTQLLNDAHKAARLVVLDGAGADFCIGRARMGTPPARQPEALQRRRQSDTIFDAYAAFRTCRVPVICAVQGRALGFGCALAAVADITIASADAVFQVPEMEHRILPTMVMSALVDRTTLKGIGFLVWSCEEVSAERALSYGIVSDVVPADQLKARVDRVCSKILNAPPIAAEGVKDFLRRAMTMDTPSAIDYARNLHAVVNSSNEMKDFKPGGQ